MTIQELIDKLKELPQNCPVYIYVAGNDYFRLTREVVTIEGFDEKFNNMVVID